MTELDDSVYEEIADDYSVEPERGQWASFGELELVGNSVVTASTCGKFHNFWGCNRVGLHDVVDEHGVSHKGHVVAYPVFYGCDKASCPICYRRGWAGREAHRIEERLAECSRLFGGRFGLVEHIIVSVPKSDYGLSVEALRKKAVEALRVRGVVGGVMIFHGFRYNRNRGWYLGVHFHVLGFILGGYGCRGCMKVCVGCNGFEAVTRREFVKDGCIVKVAEDKSGAKNKRLSVGGTGWYQLEHSTIKKGAVRFHVATWFGVCSYRKLKTVVSVRKKRVCPICHSDLVKLYYFGNRVDIWVCRNRVLGRKDRLRDLPVFFDALRDGQGRLNWLVAGSGSYEGLGAWCF